MGFSGVSAPLAGFFTVARLSSKSAVVITNRCCTWEGGLKGLAGCANAADQPVRFQDLLSRGSEAIQSLSGLLCS